jgi:cell division protein FtsI (penicillin-binding protein 3)
MQGGIAIHQNTPVTLEENICSEATLNQLKECLFGVCNDEGGTGYSLFKTSSYPVAGKTGTALVADGKRGYADHIYQSSFAGYFPANDPIYSCIVVIRNKPFAKKYYGGAVAGPVFKEVSDKLYALQAEREKGRPLYTSVIDSSSYYYAGAADDLKNIMNELGMNYTDSSGKSDINFIADVNFQPVMKGRQSSRNSMPDIKGMGLKDVLYLLENKDVKVIAKGRGKVIAQSVNAGLPLAKGQTVIVELN